MLLLPAIDLMNGQVVRAPPGKSRRENRLLRTIRRRWPAAGRKKAAITSHVVDLDAAFSGHSGPANQAALRAIVGALTIPCELGGGLRDEESVRRALDLGIARVVIGTRAAESIDFVRRLVKTFGSARVVVGIDAKDGQVAVKGWTESANRSALDLALEAQAAGVGAIIYHRHRHRWHAGGSELCGTRRLVGATGLPPGCQRRGVEGGGLVPVESASPGLYGTIIGRALYEGNLRLAECVGHV